MDMLLENKANVNLAETVSDLFLWCILTVYMVCTLPYVLIQESINLQLTFCQPGVSRWFYSYFGIFMSVCLLVRLSQPNAHVQLHHYHGYYNVRR